jgi:RNase adaptor protein for sRNA GlmZ degradation
MIVDLKIDLSSFGEKHAQQIDADGFVTIKSTPYERVAHEQ